MVALLDTAGRVDLELEQFESIPAGDHQALLRVAARWLLAPGVDAPEPTLVLQRGAVRERFSPLPGAPEGWRFDDGRDWWAGYAVPLDLVLDARVRFWLEADGPPHTAQPSTPVRARYPLPRPVEGDATIEGPTPQVVVRNGRPHLLVAAGLMAVALAQPTAAAAQEPAAPVVPAPTEATAASTTPLDPAEPVEPAPAEAPAPAPAPAAAPAAPAPAPAPAPAVVVEEVVPAPTRKPKAKPKRDRKRAKPERKPEKTERKQRKATRKRRPKRTTQVAPAKAVTPTTPTTTAGLDPTPSVTKVPSPLLENFAIPPFLLPIYQAAGTEYGIPWQLLAAINEVETNFGRNLNVSSAGAQGWMQFMPATWEAYGVDANLDDLRDPNNPADAIFAAARYLDAAGASESLSRAIFAYNHADWYVDLVLGKYRAIKEIPNGVIDSLTGLTQARFPVQGPKVRYSHPERAQWQAEDPAPRRAINIRAAVGHRVVAVADGRVVAMGESRNGGWIVLEDAYGNRFTYGHLGRTMRRYATPKPKALSRNDIRKELDLPRGASKRTKGAAKHPEAPAVRTFPKGKERLFAHPERPAVLPVGGQRQLDAAAPPSVMAAAARALGLKPSEIVLRRLKPGARVVAGTILGRLGGHSTDGGRAHVKFKVRPAGKGAPAIDPTPLLDGWKLLRTTEVYGPAGSSTLFSRRKSVGVGRLLLMNKGSLAARVLADPRIQIYEAGRNDIRSGQIDRRVLALLAYLAESGLHPTVTSLKAGHGFYTASGNVSHHSSGHAVDIAAVNGTVITPGTQGPNSITEKTIRAILRLQGAMEPAQIISLMQFPGRANTFAMGDHDDHIHVGFQPDGEGRGPVLGKQVAAVLEPGQWDTLMGRLAAVENPRVSTTPSRYALKAKGGK
jgi:murein DD-endopeptidase MepM/ murein hydrolase activator NlpD